MPQQYITAIFGLIGVLIGSSITIYLNLRKERLEAKNDTIKRWTELNGYLVELERNLSALAQTDDYIKRTFENGGKDPNLKHLMELSPEYFRKVTALEQLVIDSISGTNKISREDKEMVLRAIVPRLLANENPNDIYSRARKVDSLLKQHLIARADNDIAEITKKILLETPKHE